MPPLDNSQAELAWQNYQAEQAWNDYQRREQVGGAIRRSVPLGPNYDASLTDNAIKAAVETPRTMIDMAGSIYDFVTPYKDGQWQIPVIDPIRRAGVEGTARVAGPLAAGVAGAGTLGAAGAGTGAAVGSIFGPVGTLIGGGAGGILGGAAGFGAGLMGFDMATDAAEGAVDGFKRDGLSGVTEGASSGLRPYDQYLKDMVYNTTQGALQGGAFKAVGSIPRVKALAEPFTQGAAETRVAEKLGQWEPDLVNKIDTAYAADPQNPFLEQKPLGELVGSDVLMNAQRSLARGGIDEYGRAAERSRSRVDSRLKYLEGIDEGFGAEVAANLDNARGVLASLEEQKAKAPIDQQPLFDEYIAKANAEIQKLEQSPRYNLEDAQSAVKAGVEGDIAAKRAPVTALEGEVGNMMERLPASIDPAEAGGRIREGLQSSREGLDTRIQNKFEATGEGAVDISSVKAAADRLMPDYFREVGAQPNEALQGLIDDLNRPGTTSGIVDASGQQITTPAKYNLQDTQALRSKALEISQKSSDRRVRAVANAIAQELKNAEDLAVKRGTVSEAEASNLNEGRKLRKTKGELYESSATPAKSVLATQAYGELKVPDSAIPSKYFKAGERGTREAIRNFKETVGASDTALEPLYRYATDSFRNYVVDAATGKINSKKAGAWLRMYDSALSELPELRKQLSNIDSAQRFLNEKFGDLTRTEAEMQKGALATFLQADPSAAIKQMLSGKGMVQNTVRTVQYLKGKDPDAVSGLRRGVIDHLKKVAFEDNAKVGLDEAAAPGGARFDGKFKGGAFNREWTRIKPALERSKLFTDSQMKAFDQLYRDTSGELAVEGAKMRGGSDTIQNESVLKSLGRMAASGYLKNLPGGSYIRMAEPILAAIPAAKFQATLENAILNPRYARELMMKPTSKNLSKSISQIFSEEMKAAGTDISKTDAVLRGSAKVAQFGAGALLEGKSTPLKPGTASAPKPAPDPTLSSEEDRLRATMSGMYGKPKEPPAPRLPTEADYGTRSVNVNREARNSVFPDPRKFLAGESRESMARISAESDFNPAAVSRKGAEGLNQIMPRTGRWIAEQLGEEYTPLRPGMNRFQQEQSIKQNIRFGNHYSNYLLRKFKDPILARAAYNAGEGRIAAAQKQAGPGASVKEVLARLTPGVQKETIPYVNKIFTRLSA